MKLTEKEKALAKRAITRNWCHGDAHGKHEMKPYIFPDMTIGRRCINCPHTTKAKEVTP